MQKNKLKLKQNSNTSYSRPVVKLTKSNMEVKKNEEPKKWKKTHLFAAPYDDN